MNLVKYDAMCQAIEAASSVDEVKNMRDQAQALETYARQARNFEAQNKAAEIRIRAEYRAGELLAEMEMARGVAGQITGERTSTGGRIVKPPVDDSPTLSTIGISKSQSSRWQRIANIPRDKFEEMIASAGTARELVSKRFLSYANSLAAQSESEYPQPDEEETCTVSDLFRLVGTGKKFGCIYADPPWIYGNQGTRAATGNHYEGLSVDEIKELPVSELTSGKAHCHLWTTNAFLPHCFSILEAWGFEYKSCFVWVKPQMGIGNYWRVSHEFLLLGVKGSLPFRVHNESSWKAYDRRQHSAKPEQIIHTIMKTSPGPYLELFGRRVVPGWAVWGNQIERTMFDDMVATI